LVFGQVFLLGDIVEKFAPFAQIGNQKADSFCFPGFVKFDNVGVVLQLAAPTKFFRIPISFKKLS
jgi:hypothetical protein